jgi:hypothetical protein
MLEILIKFLQKKKTLTVPKNYYSNVKFKYFLQPTIYFPEISVHRSAKPNFSEDKSPEKRSQPQARKYALYEKMLV